MNSSWLQVKEPDEEEESEEERDTNPTTAEEQTIPEKCPDD
jgi:hypothetical protein